MLEREIGSTTGGGRICSGGIGLIGLGDGVDAGVGEKPHAIHHERRDGVGKSNQQDADDNAWDLVLESHDGTGIYLHPEHNCKSDNDKDEYK